MFSVGIGNHSTLESSHDKEGEVGEDGNEDGAHDSSMTYSSVAYDALWIASKSMDKNSTINRNNGDYSSKDFNDILVETAESYNGVTGEIDLNLAGDRISENYDFWYVAEDDLDDEFKWQTKFKDFNSDH